LANIASAKKRARQAIKHQDHNVTLRTRVRSAHKKVLKAIQTGNKDEAVAAFRAAVPVIDAMVTKGIIHKNNAARNKSRLNARIKAMA
jgi:small subunit ribosomal protein S20